jgi:hypothetical protein
MKSYQAWCRLALFAFPRDYRRRRGPEMLATLLDGSCPGQTRPSVRELLGIVAGGLRCRLRLRPGAGPLVLACSTVLTTAILGGAAATWLAWAITSPALPSDAEAKAIAQAVVGAAPAGVRRTSIPYHLDFDVEQLSGVEVAFPDNGLAWAPRRLNTEGWSVARADNYGLVAYRADLKMTVLLYSRPLLLRIDHAEPPIVTTATIAGFLLCGLGGWLLNARLGRRCAGRPAVSAWIVAVGALTIEFFLPLCFYALVEYIGGHINGGQAEPVWSPLGWQWVRVLAGTGVAMAIALLVVSLMPVPPDTATPRKRSMSTG